MRRPRLGDEKDLEALKALLGAKNPGWKQTRLLAIKMGFNPENTLNEISNTLNVSVSTVDRWLKVYRSDGLQAAVTRGYGIGRPSNCYDEVQQYLQSGLIAGRWNTAVQAHQELQIHFDQRFEYKTVWRWLKKCAGVIRVPRPVHEKRNSEKAEAFKRDFYGHLCRLPISGKKALKVWFADESRYGLLPNLRRVWTCKGLRPVKKWQSKYDWSYCYGAIDVVEGESVFIQTPTVNLEWTEVFLKQIKKQYPEYEHIVVWDGAGFHPVESSHEMVPEGIHIITLPPYSPELNPIEKLWDLIQDQTANKLWPSIKRLDQVVALHLKDWWEDPQKVIRLVGKGWIRASANASVA